MKKAIALILSLVMCVSLFTACGKQQGGSRTFTELLQNAGLESPFDESCLRGVCAAAEQWLDSFDMTGIL